MTPPDPLSLGETAQLMALRQEIRDRLRLRLLEPGCPQPAGPSAFSDVEAVELADWLADAIVRGL